MKAKILPALLVLMTAAVVGGLSGCISGNKQFAYVTGPGTNEVFEFKMDSRGALTALSPGNAAVGSSPVAVAVQPAGDFAYIANFAGNNVTLLTINRGNGQLSIPVSTNPIPPPTPSNIFSTGTGPIAIVISTTNPFLYVANQGSNNISAFTIDPKNGNLGTISGSPFLLPASPGSMSMTPKGDLLYVGHPGTGTINVMAIGANGVLSGPTAVGPGPGTLVPTFVLAEPRGKFLYVADAVHNQVWGFSIGGNGALTAITGSPFAAGVGASALATDPQGALLFAANKGSNTVSAYVIDAGTGALGPVSGSPFATPGKGPGFLAASSTFLYVADQTTNDLAGFAIGNNGTLTPVAGSPFNVAVSATWISLIRE
jgi:6-phosphogluconolactonase